MPLSAGKVNAQSLFCLDKASIQALNHKHSSYKYSPFDPGGTDVNKRSFKDMSAVYLGHENKNIALAI